MGLVLFILVLLVIALTMYLLTKGKVEGDNDERPYIYPKFKFKGEDEMQEVFKEAYLWACNTFGVKKNAYDELQSNLKEYPSLGIDYFTYYYVSEYPSRYPKYIPDIKNKIREHSSIPQQFNFVVEFLTIVDNLRCKVDEDELKLFNKYNIDIKYLLTNEFEVDKLSLYSLPQ